MTSTTHSASRSRRWLLPLIIVVVVLAAVLLLVNRGGEGSDRPSEERRIPVTVQQAETRTMQEEVRVIGSLRAAQAVQLAAEVGGRLLEIRDDEGQWVEAGTLLAQLDDGPAQQRLAAAEASLAVATVEERSAQRMLTRRRDLLSQGTVAAEEVEVAQDRFDSARAQRQRLQAEVALAQRAVEDSQIRAPFAGLLGGKAEEVGAHITSGTVLTSLANPDPIEAVGHLPERYRAFISVGSDITIIPGHDAALQVTAQIHALSPHIDERTRSFQVRARAANGERQLVPGSSVTMSFIVREAIDQVVVPPQALIATREGYQVFVVADDQAQARQVRIGIRDGDGVAIVDGLNEGERVVVSGHLRLNDGDSVRIVSADDEAAALGQTP